MGGRTRPCVSWSTFCGKPTIGPISRIRRLHTLDTKACQLMGAVSSAKRDVTHPRATALYRLILAIAYSENVCGRPYINSHVRIERGSDNNRNQPFLSCVDDGRQQKENKVITTKVIGLLDDRTYCARSVFTRLGLWRKLYDCFIASLHNQEMYPKMSSIDISTNLQPVG